MTKIIVSHLAMARHLIMTGNPLEPKLLLIHRKLCLIPRVMTSEIVITFRIGQSAGKVSKSAMIGYDTPSTTARVPVGNDSLINLNLHKIQSSPIRKLLGITYIQRRIVKLTEDITVQYDGSVRDNFGKVYQLSYGEDLIDPTKMVKVNGEKEFCDVSRLVDKLNLKYEIICKKNKINN